MNLKVESDNVADDNYYGFGDNDDDDGASALLMVLLQCLATTDSYY